MIIAYTILFLNLVFQEYESFYALNQGSTTNKVSENVSIAWRTTKDLPQDSYIRIKKKTDSTYYINVLISGQFAYGHYFKYIGKIDGEYEYLKVDGLQDDYIRVNHPLSELAYSNKYDEHVVIKLINYRTSFGMLLKF